MPKKILLVEDEALIALNESKQLNKHGFEVELAYSGEKAIEKVRNEPDISLILMDIDLGERIDGTEAAAAILKSRTLPIVFLTSHSEREIVEKVKGISRYGYVLKNSGEFVLVEAINMAFELFEAHQTTKTRELRLQQQMEELSVIYRHAPSLLVLLDSELKVRKANAAAAEFVDASPGALLHHRVGEALRCINHLNHPQGCGYGPHCRNCAIRTSVLSTFKTRNPHTRVEASIPVLHNGTEKQINFLLSTVYLSLKDEPTVFVSIEDITERTNLETELKQREENLRITLNSIGDAVFSTNLDGQVVRMNPVAEKLTGWDFASANGKRIEEVFRIIDSTNGEVIDNPIKRVLETGRITALSNHTKLISKTGGEYQIADSAAPIKTEDGKLKGAVLVFRDVSEQYRQEQELRESEEKYRELVDNAPIGIFQTNSRGQALHANSAMARMLGAESPEAALAEYQDLASQIYVNPGRRKDLLEILGKQGHVENFEYKARTRHNEHRWFSMNARVSAVLDDGTMIIDGFAIDISEQKQARGRIESALEEKQNLIVEMNHRVKNNLALVASLINLKESSTKGEVDLSDIVHQIHAIRLVHEQLYSNNDATHTELRGYLNDIVHSVFSALPGKKVKIENSIESITVPSSLAVPLGLITNEIATNAVKHGFNGRAGTQNFALTLHRDPEKNGMYVYTLSNSGPPLPAEIDIKASDSLGLQLVHTLVTQIDGTLELQKSPEPVFTIRFPAW